MAKHDALVSGSVTLQFFDRAIWQDSEMCVYTRKTPLSDRFGKFVKDVGGMGSIIRGIRRDVNGKALMMQG